MDMYFEAGTINGNNIDDVASVSLSSDGGNQATKARGERLSWKSYFTIKQTKVAKMLTDGINRTEVYPWVTTSLLDFEIFQI